jgi:hypothetical protein
MDQELKNFIMNVLPWKTWTWCLIIIALAQVIQCGNGPAG